MAAHVTAVINFLSMQTKRTELPLGYIRALSLTPAGITHGVTNHAQAWSWMRELSRAHRGCDHVTRPVFLPLSTKCFATQWSGTGVQRWRLCGEGTQSLRWACVDSHVSSARTCFLYNVSACKVPRRGNNETSHGITTLCFEISCFKPGHRLNWRKFFMLFLTAARKFPGQCLKTGHDRLLSDPSQLMIKHLTIRYCIVWVSHTAVK
jgi:hypothetical protein